MPPYLPYRPRPWTSGILPIYPSALKAIATLYALDTVADSTLLLDTCVLTEQARIGQTSFNINNFSKATGCFVTQKY